MPRLRINDATPPVPLYVFMAHKGTTILSLIVSYRRDGAILKKCVNFYLLTIAKCQVTLTLWTCKHTQWIFGFEKKVDIFLTEWPSDYPRDLFCTCQCKWWTALMEIHWTLQNKWLKIMKLVARIKLFQRFT